MRKKCNWTGRRSTNERFVGLPHYLVMGKDGAGQAFRALSSNARSALIQIAARYNGVNNGLINASSRALALEMNVSRATAARAVRELIGTGFVEVTEWGRFALKDRHANAYRLTWRVCDRTNQPASKAFAKGKGEASKFFHGIVDETHSLMGETPMLENGAFEGRRVRR
jgi:DNA-binding MurR/RpiR family transcriptional regulator